MSDTRLAVVVDGTRFVAPIPDGTTLTFGTGTSADVHLPGSLSGLAFSVRRDGDTLALRSDDRVVSGGPEEPLHLATDRHRIEVMAAPVAERVVYDLTGRESFVVGPQPGAALCSAEPGLALTADRAEEHGVWNVSITGPGVFVNNVHHQPGRYRLHSGDHLGVGAYDLVLFDGELHVDDRVIATATLPRRGSSTSTPPPGYPDLRRSPRLIHREPTEKITVNPPPTAEQEKRSGQLLKLILPPLGMVGVTAMMAILRGNMLLVIGSAATTVITLSLSISTYVKERRAAAEQRAAEDAEYREYLDRKAVQIGAVNDRQRHGALYHYPDVATLLALGEGFSPRLFEKTSSQFDFLHYRLGLGTVPTSSTIDFPDQERGGGDPELGRLVRHLAEQTAELTDMPITADLMHGAVGYVGPRRLVIEQLQLLVNQLATFHSYHDVQFVMVFGEDEHADWSWMRWFRHASLQEMNLRGFVYDQRSRDQVLSSLNQILKARQNARSEARAGQSTTFSPHYVVVILDEALVLDHVVMEFLREDPTALGCSVIYVQETMSSLSDSITTVIDVRDRDTGVLVLERGELRQTPFVLDHVPDRFDKERLPRAIGAREHLLNLRSSIPESVTFLEMYAVERFEDLGVPGRWAANSPHRTLGVPLGLRGPGDIVKLDLHEKAHGPHGLVAGTTGSGKSEIIQSYILSLAVNFHPHDVAFLLIDYKGGGMANLFADLPHLLGAITNLDGAQSMRALVSINAELKRRQRVFSAHQVNHINQYQKLYKNGDAAEPMPHLFLISDEFAELKSEQPEFMAELISTARIGRSLGIHLILATQKPSGVVNDQIWSNSKFKLALKVADRSDSMEIIKTPDAAEITLPGRAYLQVGNNEIYELFQSAWSGADYEPEKEQSNQDDHTIYAINDLGQYQILNDDLSGLDDADQVRQIPSELEAVVQGIQAVAAADGIAPLPRPWLPPLADRIHVTDLHQPVRAAAWSGAKQPMRPTVGQVDIPSMQIQETLRIDLSEDGHLAVYGSPGYGKSTFLQTLVMDLARTHNPEHLHVYLLDFATNGLLPLRGLPQVADTITVDDTQKTMKFIARIEAEIKRRKQLLSTYSVASLPMYERASGEVLPHLVVVLDGFEGLKGTTAEDPVTAVLHTIAREGAGLGVHLVLSAGRQASLRTTLSSNIKLQVALKLNEEAEARSIVGRTQLEIDDLPGRGMIKLEQPEIFQTALPAPGDDVLAIIDAIQAEATAMSESWTGTRPVPIPVIPDQLSLAELVAHPDIPALRSAGVVPVGLDFDRVRPAGLHPAKHRQVVVLCPDSETLGRTISGLWDTIGDAYPAGPFVLDDLVGTLRPLVDRVRESGGVVGDQGEVLAAAVAELDARRAAFQAAPGSPTLAEFGRSLPRALVVVADPGTLGNDLGRERAADLMRLLDDGALYGLHPVFGGTLATAGKGYDDVGKAVKKSTAGLVLGKMADQNLLKASNLSFKEPALGENEAYVVADGLAVRVKLPSR